MHLIRLIVLRSLQYNFRVFAFYIKSERNNFADSLSRLQFDHFKHLSKSQNKGMVESADSLPSELWPASKIWDGYKYMPSNI